MRQDTNIIGSGGEGLFERLCVNWDARFVRTPTAKAIDGHIEWEDLPETFLWVQVKTTSSNSIGAKFVSITIRKNQTLRLWKARGVILVVCHIPTDSAWWLDTAEILHQGVIRAPKTFRVPRSQKVDDSTKDVIRQVALGRPRYLALCQAPFTSRWLIPLDASGLDARTPFEEQASRIYGSMSELDVIGRDAMALKMARYVFENKNKLTGRDVGAFVNAVLERMRSGEWGGRSYTFGAILCLLHPELGIGLPSDIRFQLRSAIDNVLSDEDFLHPGFALLAAGLMADYFDGDEDRGFLYEHSSRISANPSSPEALNLSRHSLAWLDGAGRAFSSLFSLEDLIPLAYRPLPPDSPVRLNPEAVSERVMRVAAKPLASRTDEENSLFDTYIRWLAEHIPAERS